MKLEKEKLVPRKNAYFDVEGPTIFPPNQDTFERESGFKNRGKKRTKKHSASIIPLF